MAWCVWTAQETFEDLYFLFNHCDIQEKCSGGSNLREAAANITPKTL